MVIFLCKQFYTRGRYSYRKLVCFRRDFLSSCSFPPKPMGKINPFKTSLKFFLLIFYLFIT